MGWTPGLYQLYRKYEWVTRNENCAICEAMRGRVYRGDYWAGSGIFPGFHAWCDCSLRLVPDDTPMSPMDIYPKYLTPLLGLALNSPEGWGPVKYVSLFPGGWVPYNQFLLDEFMRATPSGGKIADAIQAFKAGSLSDSSILVYPKWRSLINSLGWKSWITLMRDLDARLKYTVDFYQGVDDNIFSEWSLHPGARWVRPVSPYQSFYYPRGAKVWLESGYYKRSLKSKHLRTMVM